MQSSSASPAERLPGAASVPSRSAARAAPLTIRPASPPSLQPLGALSPMPMPKARLATARSTPSLIGSGRGGGGDRHPRAAAAAAAAAAARVVGGMPGATGAAASGAMAGGGSGSAVQGRQEHSSPLNRSLQSSHLSSPHIEVVAAAALGVNSPRPGSSPPVPPRTAFVATAWHGATDSSAARPPGARGVQSRGEGKVVGRVDAYANGSGAGQQTEVMVLTAGPVAGEGLEASEGGEDSRIQNALVLTEEGRREEYVYHSALEGDEEGGAYGASAAAMQRRTSPPPPSPASAPSFPAPHESLLSPSVVAAAKGFVPVASPRPHGGPAPLVKAASVSVDGRLAHPLSHLRGRAAGIASRLARGDASSAPWGQQVQVQAPARVGGASGSFPLAGVSVDVVERPKTPLSPSRLPGEGGRGGWASQDAVSVDSDAVSLQREIVCLDAAVTPVGVRGGGRVGGAQEMWVAASEEDWSAGSRRQRSAVTAASLVLQNGWRGGTGLNHMPMMIPHGSTMGMASPLPTVIGSDADASLTWPSDVSPQSDVHHSSSSYGIATAPFSPRNAATGRPMTPERGRGRIQLNEPSQGKQVTVVDRNGPRPLARGVSITEGVPRVSLVRKTHLLHNSQGGTHFVHSASLGAAEGRIREELYADGKGVDVISFSNAEEIIPWRHG